MDPYRWSWNPEALLLVPLMTVGYVLALRRFPRRLADRLLRHRDGAPPRRHDHAARDDRDELPARDPPSTERRSRGVGSAARRPRYSSGARGDAHAASALPHAHPPRRRAPALARELHALAPAVALRHGARAPAHAAPPRARPLLRDRGGHVVERRPGRAASARTGARAESSSPRSSSGARSDSSSRSSPTRSTTSTSTRPNGSGGFARSRTSSSPGS